MNRLKELRKEKKLYQKMVDKIIPMLVIIGFSTLFVKDEKSFYSWFSWWGLFVAISLLLYYVLGV